MPKRGQRAPIAAGALRGAGLLDDARMTVDDESGSRKSRRRLAREASDPVGRRRVNVNSLARPANARKLGSHTVGGASTPDVAPGTDVVITLRTFLQSRWRPEALMLDLTDMSSDAGLKAANIRPPGSKGAHRDIGTALWKLTGDMFPNISALSLADNGLTSLQPLSTLSQYIPKLASLSLERNEIRQVRDLDALTSRKFPLAELHELLLAGNPLQTSALAAKNEEGYRRDVLAKFPSLRLLDRRPVSEVEHGFAQLFQGRASARTAADAKVPLRNFALQNAAGFVDGDAARIVPEFLSVFFARYDQDRAALAPVYCAEACFSYCLNTAAPPRARAARLVHTMPHQKELVADRYIELGSRNIMRSHNQKALLRSLHKGPAAIAAFLARLPATAHPLHDASRFVVDSWVLPNVDVKAQTGAERPDALLFISVHGEFAEPPSQGLRSFDRSFIVAPVAPNSPAAAAGWPCVIVSDQLTVRHYSLPSAWAPGSLPTGAVSEAAMQAAAAGQPTNMAATGAGVAAAPVPAPAGPAAASAPAPAAAPPAAAAAAAAAQIAPAPGLTPEQHALALNLSTQTRLTYPFAVQCLVDNAWDPPRALASFNMLQASGTIPPEAFVPV
ncbi:nuclear mRNA export, poly(A)+RNA binding protein [Malassezia cuniculi]|uniref:mRNA export factor MEX67 n=1 Tax=Malassezia cuniculi TaxID=948313 RepID=A0AAF0J532_9BASI|nr:nuclear mRNA export, poly(A)+RNA binding protein [Malassezia cuniculi]